MFVSIRKLRAIASTSVLVGLSLLLVACGGGDESLTGQEKKAAYTVNQYFQAIKANNFVKSQCQLTTVRYIREITSSKTITRSQCIEGFSQAKKAKLPALPKGMKVKDVTIKGKKADVIVSAKGYKDGLFVLVNEGGKWKVDNFSDA